MPIISTLGVTVSSGRRKEARDLVSFIAGPMRQQTGCMSCQVYQDMDNPNRMILVEEWESREDLERHIGSGDYRKTLSLMELSNQPPEIHFHTVSETEGMELIRKIRERRELKE
jgi:quinol monooxygenase YgiN